MAISVSMKMSPRQAGKLYMEYEKSREELEALKTGKSVVVPSSVDHAKAMILVAANYLKQYE